MRVMVRGLRPVLVGGACLTLLVSALWLGYWWSGGGETRRRYWQRHTPEELLVLNLHSQKDQQQSSVTQSSDSFNPDKFSYQNFVKRRKELESRKNELESRKKALATREGKVVVYNPISVVSRDSCVPFDTPANKSVICVHDKRHDGFISSHIRDNGAWEPDLVLAMGDTLSSVRDLHVLDIGCNVGVYTLFAALMGRKVVAIDPIRSNLFLLHSSLVYAGVRDHVTLLRNAVSDIPDTMRVLINRDNLGGSRVEPLPVDKETKGNVTVNAIVMDDLVRVLDFQKVLVKMDIEGHEAKALTRASKFFQKFDVRYVMMEWLFQRHSSYGQEIVDFLTKYGFLPYADMHTRSTLDQVKYWTWPDNMVWIRRKTPV